MTKSSLTKYYGMLTIDNTMSTKISIFHNIMWSKYKGGVFSAAHEITKGTSTDITFTQIAETEGERISLGGVDLQYHRYPYELLFKGAYSNIPLYQRVFQLVKRAWSTQADIVILPGYERLEYWAMLAVLALRNKPRAVFCDSTAYDRPRSFIKAIAKRLFFSLCDGFFAYGSRSKEYLTLYNVPADKIFIHCQSAALPQNYSQENALHQRLSLSEKKYQNPHFIYVGRLSPEKDLPTLIKAFQNILPNYPRATLSIIGAGSLKDEIENLIKKEKLQGHINLLGSMSIDQLGRQYAQATAMVLPSTSEPWGLVVNEALSHGCPCIVSNICGCVPELIIEGKTGFSFQAQDASELSQKMAMSIETFSDIEETAVTCIKHMQNFSPENAASRIINGCQEILGKKML